MRSILPHPGGRRHARTLRAQAELLDMARDLAERQTNPFDALLALGRRAELLRGAGADLPAGAALAALRQLPGLANSDPLAAWQARLAALPADAASTLDTPTETEQQRQRRADILADWLRVRGRTDLAAAIVNGAELIALARLRGGRP